MMLITLRQLEYFAAAARHGGAARAAAALNVSQPSISKAIADLESLWGERLFVRLHARGLELTAAGAARFKLAQALLRDAGALVATRSSSLQGQLRVGALSTLAPRYLPDVMARLRAAHADLEVLVTEGDTETLTRQLERGALDVALFYDLGLARRVRLESVIDLWPYALLPWGHALAGRGSLRLAQLAREPLILINLPHSREYFLSLFRAAGVTPRIAHESPSIEMVRAMVAHGLGVSLLTTRPARDVSYDGKRIACRSLRGAVLPQSVVLAYPEDSEPQSGLLQVFAEMLRISVSRRLGELSGPAR